MSKLLIVNEATDLIKKHEIFLFQKFISTFAFQSYSTSLYNASLLNELTKQAVDSLIELDDIASVRLNTDYNFTDSTTKQYRYQAVYDIKHY